MYLSQKESYLSQMKKLNNIFEQVDIKDMPKVYKKDDKQKEDKLNIPYFLIKDIIFKQKEENSINNREKGKTQNKAFQVAIMEFIKLSENRYMIKNSNSIIVSKEEMLKLEQKELVLEDFSSNECQEKNTKKLKKIKKELTDESKPIEETE